MAATLKGRLQPGPHDFQRQLFRHHTLTEREHVGIVVSTSQSGRLNIPTECAANSSDRTNVLKPESNKILAGFSLIFPITVGVL